MKVLAIRGKNLASLEGEFELNFEQEPLRSAGIFAITGATGAGKSTILDALCLALFSQTPRLDEAENKSLKIYDVAGETIAQSDPRNILRRGATEGYAEVDFWAVSGERFRSRWSVRRARNSARGALQAQEMRLFNLSDGGREISGRKKELLDIICEKLGMNFKQFTRAVLLAQGAFADFLKASENDRADLLEKLTGTEIYSEISRRIYQNTAEAKRSWDDIFTKIQLTSLLPDEQISALQKEQENLLADVAQHESDRNIAEQKLRWLAEKEKLDENIADAKSLLTQAQQAFDDAEPRRAQLLQVDMVQDIRDDFNLLHAVREQVSAKVAEKQKCDASLAKNAEQISLAQDTQSKQQQAVAAVDKEWEELEILVKFARKLDEDIKVAQAVSTGADKDFIAAKKAKEDAEKSAHALNIAISNETMKMQQAKEWLDKQATFASIAQQKNMLTSKIAEYYEANKNFTANQDQQSLNEAQLTSEQEQLAKLNEKAAQLELLLPAEIARLRAELTEGAPCPVCGSIHHPIQGGVGASMQEAELSKSKKDVKAQIETLTGAILQREKEVARLKAMVVGYAEQASTSLAVLAVQLENVPTWKAALDGRKLQVAIERLAANWANNTEVVAAAQGIIDAKSAQLKAVEQQVEASLTTFADKVSRKEEAAKLLSELLQKRAEYFGGRSVDAVVQDFDARKKQAEHDAKATDKVVQTLYEQQCALNATLAQLAADIALLQEQHRTKQDTVTGWCALHDGFDEHLLAKLLSHNQQQIDDERQYLNALHIALQQAQATFAERRKNLELHLQAPVQPLEDGENRETLATSVSQHGQAMEQASARCAEIKVLLENNRKNALQKATFEVELAAKQAMHEQWQKLNELFGSADGNRFKKIAQQYTLDYLLTYANIHLDSLTHRYKLERTSDESLALQVVDRDMLNEVRTVHSLSGGESFLVSLALALGLSSLSSSRMSIESLFIDEGFGSLDADTLIVAMEALEHLQTQGRKIGVISHVDEMNQRISVKVQVKKVGGGRSRIEIKN